jgi:NAD(P)-dependent dehydrogenase (short-subunit alcohol dehydrogenase family)
VTAILDDGGTAIPFAGDVSDDATARACVEAAIDEYGRLDVLQHSQDGTRNKEIVKLL